MQAMQRAYFAAAVFILSLTAFVTSEGLRRKPKARQLR